MLVEHRHRLTAAPGTDMTTTTDMISTPTIDRHLEQRHRLIASVLTEAGNLEAVAEIVVDAPRAMADLRAQQLARGLARRLRSVVTVDVEDGRGHPVMSICSATSHTTNDRARSPLCHAK